MPQGPCIMAQTPVVSLTNIYRGKRVLLVTSCVDPDRLVRDIWSTAQRLYRLQVVNLTSHMSLCAVRKGVLNFYVLKKSRRRRREKVNLVSTTGQGPWLTWKWENTEAPFAGVLYWFVNLAVGGHLKWWNVEVGSSVVNAERNV